MPRFKLTIEYHGAPFVGWQRQKGQISVQGTIEDALRKLDAAMPGITGAGRTDAGVHATAQVAHCDLAKDWDPFRLGEALNHHLKPAPVSIIRAERADSAFHARFDAVHRRYLFRIISRRAPLALEAGLAWHVAYDLDVDAMQESANRLIGHHDFTTYRSSQCQSASPVKTLDSFTVTRHGPEIRFHLGARSFLHNQVRSFVGTLERVGAGKWTPDDVSDALAARDRAACGPVSPPHGLYLVGVTYGTDKAPAPPSP